MIDARPAETRGLPGRAGRRAPARGSGLLAGLGERAVRRPAPPRWERAVDEIREPLREHRDDLVDLRLGEPAGRDGVGELLLLVRDERGDEAGGLRPCDLRER